MRSVFVLWYVRDEGKDSEDEFLIGVYSEDAEARTTIERLKDKPGFVDAPGGFQVCPYELNKDHWTEGFVFRD